MNTPVDPSTLFDRFKLTMKDIPGLSQSELARQVGVSRAAVSNWLSGETQSIRRAHLVRAAAALNVNPLWLEQGRGPRAANSIAIASNVVLAGKLPANGRFKLDHSRTSLKDRLIMSMEAKPGMNQAELARRLGISSAAVSNWFTGATQRLQSKHLIAVADALQVDPRWLQNGIEPASPQVTKKPIPQDARRLSDCEIDEIMKYVDLCADGGNRTAHKAALKVFLSNLPANNA